MCQKRGYNLEPKLSEDTSVMSTKGKCTHQIQKFIATECFSILLWPILTLTVHKNKFISNVNWFTRRKQILLNVYHMWNEPTPPNGFPRSLAYWTLMRKSARWCRFVPQDTHWSYCSQILLTNTRKIKDITCSFKKCVSPLYRISFSTPRRHSKRE